MVLYEKKDHASLTNASYRNKGAEDLKVAPVFKFQFLMRRVLLVFIKRKSICIKYAYISNMCERF